MANTQLQTIDGSINELGKLNAKVSYVVRGDTELLMRIIFRRVPSAQWERLVENINSMGGLDGDITNLKVGDPAATKEPFQFSYDVSKANFLDWSKKKSDIDLPLVAVQRWPTPTRTTWAPMRSRSSSGPRANSCIASSWTLPAKYSGHPPLPFALKRDYGEYISQLQTGRNGLYRGTPHADARAGTASNARERIPVVPARRALRSRSAFSRREQRGRIAGPACGYEGRRLERKRAHRHAGRQFSAGGSVAETRG